MSEKEKKAIEIDGVKVTELSSLYDKPFSVLALCWLPRGQGQNKSKIDDERYMFMSPLWSKSAVGQLINDK